MTVGCGGYTGHLRGHWPRRRPAHGEMLVTTIHHAKGRKCDVVVYSLSGPDLDADCVGCNLVECYGLYPANRPDASRTWPGSTGATLPSPGRATCWCSPPAASHRPGSAPSGRAPPAGHARTGTPWHASGSRLQGVPRRVVEIDHLTGWSSA